MIRNFIKFYNADATEGGGGDDKGIEVVGTFNLGSLLGQQPEKSEEDEANAAEPANADQEKVDEPAPEKQEQEKDKPEANAAEPAKEAGKDKQPEATELSLEEVLKGKDKKDVLKALGVSEEVFDALDSAQSLTELKQFLDSRTKDWDAISATDILRENLRREYADLDDAKFDKVFKAELKKYDLESFDEDEKELGQIRLERDAKKIRDQFKKEQAQFQLPERKQSAEAQKLAEIQSAQEAQKTEYENFVSSVKSAPATKKLLQDKRLTLADGYNFEVNPDELIEATIDTSKLYSKCIKEDGTIDLERVFKINAFALGMEAYESSYLQHVRSKVNEEEMNELVNPSKGAAPVNTKDEESLGKAMANRGTHTTLGSILGL